MQIQDIAKLISAEVLIPQNCRLTSPDIKCVAALEKAGPTDLSFLVNPLYEKQALASKAGVMIVKTQLVGCETAQLLHPNPYWAFAKVSQEFFNPDFGPAEVSERAFVDSTAKIGKNVRILPNAYIGKSVVIGDDVTILPGAYIGDRSLIGNHTTIHPNAVIGSDTKIGVRCIVHAGAILGGDGFGFAPLAPTDKHPGDIAKIPQIGCVVLEDDVEIGAGTTIDRAAMGETRIGACSKIDSQVHVGHNVQVGHHTMIAGQTAIGGSAKLGNWVVVGGQVGIAGHISVGDGIILGARAGVTKTITENSEPYMGFPAQPASQWRRQVAGLRRMVDILKSLKNTK